MMFKIFIEFVTAIIEKSYKVYLFKVLSFEKFLKNFGIVGLPCPPLNSPITLKFIILLNSSLLFQYIYFFLCLLIIVVDL